jgi:chromodomain helicase DNA binding protein 8/chromodomain-helicase-DNA-binding protein 7
VKWQSLPYDQCSWESEADLAQLYEDPEELEENIAAFRRFNMLPQKRDASFYDVFLSIGERPPLKYWSKIEPSARWKDDNSLRDYQLEGLNWLLYCWYNRQSSIIADEMGLGKTVQSITFLERLYNSAGVRGPFLIVAPLSTIPHWERTVHGWTDLNCVVYHGNANSRGIIQNYEFHHVDEETGRRITTIPSPRKGGRGGVDLASFKFDILITTYEMCLNASAVLKSIPCWRVVIVDEAHRLKNKTSKFSEVLKSYTIEHRVLLTGTPIQNNLEELWALLNFLDPRSFPDGTERKFLADYDLRSAADVERLQALLKPLMLRRLKEDVETTIPVKEETIIDVELTSIQRAYYRAILEKNFTFLRTGKLNLY